MGLQNGHSPLHVRHRQRETINAFVIDRRRIGGLGSERRDPLEHDRRRVPEVVQVLGVAARRRARQVQQVLVLKIQQSRLVEEVLIVPLVKH